jgi:hypothetical protein
MGTLSSRATREIMDHTRVCPACRSHMTGQSRMMTGGRAVADSISAAPNGASATEPRSRATIATDSDDALLPTTSNASLPYLCDLPMTPQKKRSIWGRLYLSRRFFMFTLFGAVVFFVVPRLKSGATGVRVIDSDAIALETAVTNGNPWFDIEDGRWSTRPKALDIILPVGNTSFDLVLLEAGAPEKVVTIKAAGNSDGFRTVDRVGAKTDYKCVEVFIPFPDESVLPLSPERSYMLWVRLSNGCESRVHRFSIAAK